MFFIYNFFLYIYKLVSFPIQSLFLLQNYHYIDITVYPHPFAVHRSRPHILADFAPKVFFNNFGNFVNFLGYLLAEKRSHSP